jgi:hypothetical protein
LAARKDSSAHIFATFNITNQTLQPVIDLPEEPGAPLGQFAVGGDWIVLAQGTDLRIRRLSSPGIVYYLHIGRPPGSQSPGLVRLHATPHWILVIGPSLQPQIILLDKLEH